MTDDARPRASLENLWSLAWRDLGKYRVVARAWTWADRLLVVPAAVLAVGSLVAGVVGVADPVPAAAAALVAATLAGASILFGLPRRARRAINAVTYLRIFTAEVGMLLSSHEPSLVTEEAVAELRRWYTRINSAITSGSDDLRPDLFEFPPAPDQRPRLRRRPDLVG